MSTEEVDAKFGRYRSILYPIHKTETKKFFCLLLLFILISFNYNLLHSLKDMLLICNTGKAEVLPFLKTYVVAPSIVLMIFMYMKMSKSVGVYMRFNIIIGYFLIITTVSYVYLIPNLECLKCDRLGDYLTTIYPKMKPLWDSVRYWPLSLLYIHGEAWSSIVLSVSFWTLANQISSFNQANRMYSYLASVGSSLGSITAGLMLKSDWIKSDFNFGLGVTSFALIIILCIYNGMLSSLKNFAERKENKETKNKKSKRLSLFQSLVVLSRSKNLMLIVSIVLSYNIFIYLFETIWKDQISNYSNLVGKGVLATIYGNQSLYIGVMVVFFGLLAPWIKKQGWKKTALVTPITALIATLIFCVFLYFNKYIDSDDMRDASANSNILSMCVFVGLLNIVVVKASKYVLFDTTKEQAYIPLTEEEKVEGKAAIDGVGSRLGKSLGGGILSAPQIGLIHLFGDISKSTVPICLVMFAILIIWSLSVTKLSVAIKNKLLELRSGNRHKDPLEEFSEEK